MAKVSLHNLKKVFEENITAINNITLDVIDSELMVIVGPSGCGKTTMLRLIAGLEEPTSGTITIGDKVVNKVPPKDRDIAMVFQNYALYPHMSVYENMAFSLKIRKYARSEVAKSVEETAKLLGIENLLAMKPSSLSGGERQRVALGVAIVRNPKVFLLDEPFSNLDAQLRLSTRAELKSLQRKLKVTTIFVTHDQAEAMTLGDRICVLHKGIVQQIGTPMEVYSKPINRFVAGFLGAPTMNFLSGQIEFENDEPLFHMDQIKIDLPLRLSGSLQPYGSKNVVLGVRPEALSLSTIQGQSENVIKTTVDLVEPLGARIYVNLINMDGGRLVAEVSRDFSLQTGDAVSIHLDVEQIHLFEPGEMGRNIGITL